MPAMVSGTMESRAGQLILACWLIAAFFLYIYESIQFLWPRIDLLLEWTWRALELLR